MTEMSEAAREARNAYRRAYYKRTGGSKDREYKRRYWEKKAREAAAGSEAEGQEGAKV